MKSRTKFYAMLVCLFSILTATTLLSCKIDKREDQSRNKEIQKDEMYHLGPPNIVVCFVPLDGISLKEVKKLSEEFSKNFSDKQWEPYTVTILEHKMTPTSCLNDSKTRLRANNMLSWLDSTYKDVTLENVEKDKLIDNVYYIIGVTNKDISTSIHGRDDYGILGLSRLGKGKSSIISTYRVKRKKDLWKLAVHEFCHGFYGCPHCTKDDPHCIMADAKGGNPKFEIKDSLCINCASYCVIGD